MKPSLLFLSLLTTVTALAQQPNTGFSRKLKSTPPIPGLAERLGADVKQIPTPQGDRQAMARKAALTLETLPLRVVRDSKTDLPVFIERNIGKKTGPNPALNKGARLSATMAVSATYQFMGQVRGLLKLTDPEASFTVARTDYDDLGQTHVRLTQTHRGIPVLGSEMVAHLTDGEVTLLNGRYKPISTELSTTPRLTLADASAFALKDVRKTSTVRSFGDNVFRLKQSVGELCVFTTPNSGAKLAYKVTVRPNIIERWEYVIDAQTGEVLNKYDNTCTINGSVKASGKDLNGDMRSFQTYQQGKSYYMIDASRPMFNATKSVMPDKPVGAIMTMDAKNGKEDAKPIKRNQIVSSNNTDWSATAISAYYNASLAYEYYKNTFNRNGLDGAGGTMVSVINITDDKGKGLDNAFWNGAIMGYGNGKLLKPLAGGLDVAGHEMTHGVIDKTAGLEYQGQSGALNESFADIFGVMIDRSNWTIGEKVATTKVLPSGALRDLSNPNQGGKAKDPNGYQPATMAQYDTTKADNGGVHSNSGIPNFAFYKFATAIGKNKAEQVYYRALTTYLVRTSQFLDLRLAVIKSAGDLFGATSAEVTAAKNAFNAVGITEDIPTTPGKQPDLPVASGQDLILLTDLEESHLFSTNMAVTPAKFEQKTNTSLTHRPSLTDDGQVAYYVSSDKRIRSVNLTGTPSEFIVSNEAIWDNVAISKDGTKLAAVTADHDGAIYVYSFLKKKWTEFKLHNPTYTEGIETGDVQYADSFEWDFSGENIIYDAYNATGKETGYWDVSFINVWDKKANDFANGHIDRLFPNLGPGESIGNPSFSKNSPDIIAFDYVNETDSTYYIVAADLSVGKAVKIYQNNTLGFPSYSRLDDKLVFNSIDSGSESVAAVALGANKLSISGKPVVLYTGAKWPVWYTQATRNLPAKTAQTITFNPIADRYVNQGNLTLKATSTAKLPVSFQLKSGPAILNGATLKFTGPGKVTVRAYQDGNEQFGAAPPVDQTFTVRAVAGIEGTLVETDVLTVYPNPVSTMLNIELPASRTIERLTLRSLTGATALEPTIQGQQQTMTMDVSSLPKGLYLLQVQTPTGTLSQKVLKE